MQIQNDASAGGTPLARTSCASQCVSVIVARIVSGVGRVARAAKSMNPHGHGSDGP